MTLEDVLQKNAALRNIHAGRRCFIIGNGPSLASQDLKKLAGETNIVVSSFFRHPDAKTIQPRYWLIADPYFWQKPEEFFIPTFHAAVATDLSTKLFFPIGAFQYISGFNLGTLIDPHFFHYDSYLDFHSRIDFTRGIPQNANNVIMIAIMLAYFMGCNPIYLVGCDHDFLNITEAEYEKSEVKHFYPDAKPRCPIDFLSWKEWEKAMKEIAWQYNQLSSYAEHWGFNVFNATRGGCLEAFPRVEYESLFVGDEPCLLKDETKDPFRICESAVQQIKVKDYDSALVLLEEAIRCNINRSQRVECLEYLKALCLTSLGKPREALLWARQDYNCNPGNRSTASPLIARLESFLS